jgi:hypothetical protein
MKTVIKTQEMIYAFDEQQTASIKASAINFFESEESAENAVLTYQRIIGLKPTFDQYEMGRLLFLEAITEVKPDITDNALNVRWNTFSKKLGIDKPKKTDSADAVRKANERALAKEKQQEEFKGMTIEELKHEAKNLLSNPTLKNIEQAKKYTKQAELLYKEANKEEQEQKAQLVKDLTAWAKDQSYLDLYTICENMGVI